MNTCSRSSAVYTGYCSLRSSVDTLKAFLHTRHRTYNVDHVTTAGGGLWGPKIMKISHSNFRADVSCNEN